MATGIATATAKPAARRRLRSRTHRLTADGPTPRPVPPVSAVANSQDMPARACLNCEHPLPVDIDDRRIVTIAVLGYTFKKDTVPGETNGDGFLNGAWHMAKP